ncbi:hypothetical protein PHLCEN_2v4176 [Hermanssonia centrifuga]|uniref:Uncharacterized protein n=1 Tax=Hermanssonia centrifuga TaxID=98765 RepID=A0A2R6PZ27_9APHY|nr:hypothetical protein PHLCEN_2v4176 [Hermanssonia centrifuga]
MNHRSPSVSSSRAQARRLPHQPSPPPPTRIPQQTRSPVNPFRAQSFNHRESDSNLFDPFVVNSGSDNESSESTPSKSGDKPLTFRAPPQLASRPTGKLARRRQSGQAIGSPTPSKAVPVPRVKGTRPIANLARSEPNHNRTTPQRPVARRVSTELPIADWDEFPVCDENVFSPPSTPVRGSTSVPPKHLAVTWQQTLLDDAPRTAPLSSTFTFPFAPGTLCATPSPAHRRRHHHRVPSEGVFAMSTDEESSSDSSDELKKAMSNLTLFNTRAHMGARRTPSPPVEDGMPAGFYAGSVFQNSPSPDDLPVPAFRV